MKCFYHSSDLDGHCSGAIVKYRYPECEMFPINYGDGFPWDEIQCGDEIFMVDFCLQPHEEMKRFNCDIPPLTLLHYIDHHADAVLAMRDMLNPNNFTFLGKTCLGEKAACELTWEYLFPDKPIPLAVKLLSLYDSWTYQGHELEPMVLPFQMRMRMEDLDPKNWSGETKKIWEFLLYYPTESCDEFIDQLVIEGNLLLRYDEEQKRRYVHTFGFEIELIEWEHNSEWYGPGLYGDVNLPKKKATYKAIAVNLGHTNSKVFDSVWRQECKECVGKGEIIDYPVPDAHIPGQLISCPYCKGTGYIEPYDLMITFCRSKNKIWYVGLYSTKKEIDCGAIAKSFGGGGHKGAAGFQCKNLPFEY